MGNVCVVTEGRTLLVITQVSSGLKNRIFSSLANLSNFSQCKTLCNHNNYANVWPCIVSLAYLSGLVL